MYLFGASRLFTVTASGVGTSIELGAPDDYITDVVVREPYAYSYKALASELSRRRLDASGTPEVLWGCASGLVFNRAVLFANATQVFMSNNSGTFRFDTTGAATSGAHRLYPLGDQLLAVDDLHLYFGSPRTLEAADNVDRGCSCSCATSALAAVGGAGGGGGTGGALGAAGASGGGGMGGNSAATECVSSLGMRNVGGSGGWTADYLRDCVSGAAPLTSTDLDSYDEVIVDGSAIYAQGNLGIERIAKNGSSATRIVGRNSINPSLLPYQFAIDDSHLFVWAGALDQQGSTTQTQVVRMNKDGSNAVVLVGGAGRGRATGLVATSQSVFYLVYDSTTCKSELRRAPKEPDGGGDGGASDAAATD